MNLKLKLWLRGSFILVSLIFTCTNLLGKGNGVRATNDSATSGSTMVQGGKITLWLKQDGDNLEVVCSDPPGKSDKCPGDSSHKITIPVSQHTSMNGAAQMRLYREGEITSATQPTLGLWLKNEGNGNIKLIKALVYSDPPGKPVKLGATHVITVPVSGQNLGPRNAQIARLRR